MERVWFKKIRPEMGLTQGQLAKITGFDYRLIGKTEKGGSIKVSTAKK